VVYTILDIIEFMEFLYGSILCNKGGVGLGGVKTLEVSLYNITVLRRHYSYFTDRLYCI
jgi:hypothetical protein